MAISPERKAQIETLISDLGALIDEHESKEVDLHWGTNYSFALVAQNRNNYAGYVAQRDLYRKMLFTDDYDENED